MENVKVGDLIGITYGAGLFDHGCADYAVGAYQGDGKVTITEANSCTSCWQVGHDSGHVFANVGDTMFVSAVEPNTGEQWAMSVTWNATQWGYYPPEQ